MMRQRLETLRRLVSLYAVVEEMHSAELHQMTAAVHDAVQAIGVEQDMAKSVRIDGHYALAIGDRVGWMMSETQQKTSVWRRQRLEQVLQEREQLNDTARQQFMASRLRREQMEHVFDEVSAWAEIEEGRRIQVASDDRFLARRRWTEAKKKIRVDQR
jgi:hypothetical protein